MNIINCKEIRQRMLDEAKIKIHSITQQLKLVVLQVEGDAASDVYIRNKLKTCEEVGIICEHVKLNHDIDCVKLYEVIVKYSNDPTVTGLMLQLPLPDHLKPAERTLLDAIPYYKDVDALSTASIGRYSSGQPSITPATPQGIMQLLDQDLSGVNICILGRSQLVGKPLIQLLLNKNATVTVCHSKTDSLQKHLSAADIVISAIGKAKFIKCLHCMDKYGTNHVKTIIDVGINRDENNKLCGDIDIDTFKYSQTNITPVPGGVGTLTTAQLVLNVIKAYELQKLMTYRKEDNYEIS
jgi:methylenetetrahydrofolate dehydrogenase (NADP+)/methenyltetrahydrofolate cyclohydrolase